MYILREYLYVEYEIKANTRKEAIEKFEKSEYEKLAEWLDKYTIRKVKEDYSPWK